MAATRTGSGWRLVADLRRAHWLARLTPQILCTWLSLLAAGLYLGGFLVAGALRLLYAFPLEAEEDASLQVLRQIVQGHPIYAPPTLQYVPVIYPPLYFYLSALVASVTGAGFLPLRLVSFGASIASAGIIYRLVHRETASRGAGFISAGLFVGTTVLALDTLDLARVDALGVCLLLAVLYTVRTADFLPRRAGRLSAAAGFLAGLAVLTKQTEAVVALAMLVYLAPSPRTRLLPYAVTLAATLGVALLAINAQAGLWARVYLLDLARFHELDPKHVANFWSAEILPQFTLPVVLGPLFLVGCALRGDRRTAVLYSLAVVSLTGIAWGGWANRGSSFNVLEPAFAGWSMLFGLGIAEGIRLLAGPDATRTALRGYLVAACVVEFLIVGYNPRSTVPLRSDGWAGERLAATIEALPGTVFGPGYGEWSRLAGKGDQPAYGSIMEIGGASGEVDPDVSSWQSDVRQALIARRYDYVLLDPMSDAFFLKGAVEQSGYVDSGPLFMPGDEFYLWKGASTPDAHVYVPVERAH